jgi:hypothetical protein
MGTLNKHMVNCLELLYKKGRFSLVLFFNVATIAQPATQLKGVSYLSEISVFKEDSVPYYANNFAKFGVIRPLKESSASVEIRVYSGRRWGRFADDLFIITSNKGKIEFADYNGKSAALSISDDMSKLGWKLVTKDGNNGYFVMVSHPQPSISGDVLFQFLDSNHLFLLKDEISLIDSMKSAGVALNDPCKGMPDCFSNDSYLIEIKMGRKIRSFRITAMDYAKTNPTISSFLPYSNLYYGFVYPRFDNIKGTKTL